MKKITQPAVATLCILFASAAYGSGGGKCIPVHGFVQSTPAKLCDQAKADYFAWPSDNSEGADPLLILVNSQLPPGKVCLDIKGFGVAQFTGSSGLTAVQVGNAVPTSPFFVALSSPVNPFGATPLNFGSGVRAGLTVFTSQAVLDGKLHGLKGKLYTKDTGVITSDGMVGQVLKIVGGSDDFKGASGTIAVAGQEVGGLASYTGEVCAGKPGK